MLRLTLFIYLTTFKVFLFCFITTYNADFKITFDKLANIRSTLPSNLQLAAYLHRIEDIYLDFATSQQLVP